MSQLHISREKTNSITSEHAAQAYSERQFSAPVDFLSQESLLLRRNMSARISLRGLRRLIWVDTLRRSHNVGFLAERLNYLFMMIYILWVTAAEGRSVIRAATVATLA